MCVCILVKDKLNIVVYFICTGNCSSDQSVLLNSSDTFSQYQFRVELSQGAPCHCVTLASISHSLGIVQEEWNNGTFWCGEEQPSGPMLCASEHSSRFFISRVVQIEQQLPSTLTCAGAKFSTSNTQTLAVAYSKTFFGTCPSKDTCFPWKVVENNEKFEDSRLGILYKYSYSFHFIFLLFAVFHSNSHFPSTSSSSRQLLVQTAPMSAMRMREYCCSRLRPVSPKH